MAAAANLRKTMLTTEKIKKMIFGHSFFPCPFLNLKANSGILETRSRERIKAPAGRIMGNKSH